MLHAFWLREKQRVNQHLPLSYTSETDGFRLSRVGSAYDMQQKPEQTTMCNGWLWKVEEG